MTIQENCEKESSFCLVVRTGNIFNMDAGWQKRAAKIELRRGELRSFSKKSHVKGRRCVLHREGLELTKVIASSASSCGRNDPVAVVSNLFLSQEDEILPSTVVTTKGEGCGTVRSMLGGRSGNAA